MKNYIQSPQHSKDLYTRPAYNGRWTPVDKIPISKIQIDKSLFAFQNDVSKDEVNYIVENFELSVWHPILLNRNYFLLDGQHRLEVAKRLGLDFIDVIIEDVRIN